jgi:hypothetical protein
MIASRSSAIVRRAVVAAGVGLGLAGAMSCSDPDYRPARYCDYTVQRCRSVCDYWCDYYGCYPMCWDQCWDDCYVQDRPREPVVVDGSAPARDGGAPAEGSPVGQGGGVLCSACTSNADCAPGALCIVRGGPPADSGADAAAGGSGFCGHACTGGPDCPQGFVCTQIGSNRQCLPASGSCN